MSWEDDARRVAEIFGVPAGQRLPAVSRQTLRHYHTYLTAHLIFPFHAAIEDLDGVITVKSLFTLQERFPVVMAKFLALRGCRSGLTERS